MTSRTSKVAIVSLAAAFAAACSQNGAPSLSTASVAPEKAAQAKVDPACISLASQIDTLKREGSVERLEKAAVGKSSSVQVKRDALAKQAELNKAYADFQMRCGPAILRPQTAQVTPSAATAATSPAATTTIPTTQVPAKAPAASVAPATVATP